MNHFPAISIPPAADKAAGDVRPLVEKLRGFAQMAVRIDAEIREMGAPIASARRDLDVSETALAVAEETGAEPRKARQERDTARARLTAVEESVDHKKRARAGIDAQRAEIEAEVAALRPALEQHVGEVRGLFRAACSKALHDAMIGPLGLLDALRFCAMSRATIREPHQDVLDDITIRDPLTPGAPVHRLIFDQKYFVEGGLVEDLLTSWRDVPELLAIENKIGPIVKLAGDVTVISNRVRERQDRERAELPAAPRPKAPPDPTLAMTDVEYRAHRAAEANANRVYPAPNPNPPSFLGFRRFA